MEPVGGIMVEVNFVSGIESDSTYPKYLRANGLKHRFAVLQNTRVEGRAEPFVDESLWRALASFAPAYDASAEVVLSIRSKTPDPDFYSLADYDALPQDDRPLPGLLALRKSAKFHLCMIAEAYDLSDVPMPFPYKDACVYSIFTDRDIGTEVVAFLRAHPASADWKLSPAVIAAAASEQYPTVLSRDNAVIPKRHWEPAWTALAMSVVALPIIVMCVLDGLPRREPIAFWVVAVAIYGFIALNFAWEIRDLKVALSWEGIRWGAGSRSKFVAWTDAFLEYKNRKITARSGQTTITVCDSLYNKKEFANFFQVVNREMIDRGLQRAALLPNLISPPYTVTREDLKAYWKHKGVGRKRTFPPPIGPYTATALYMVPTLAFLIRYSARRHAIPHILQSPPAYLTAAIAATLVVAALAFLIERLFSARRAWKNLTSSWRCLQDFTVAVG